MPTVFIASDHRGFGLKNKLKLEHPEFIDLGPAQLDPSDDYNDAAIAVAKKVLEAPGSFGILICGSAIGVSIQANRFKGIRAAVVSDIESAKKTREHNDANVLCLSSDHLLSSPDPLESETALENISALVDTFLSTPFSGEPRHVRRIKRLDKEN